MNGWNFTSAKFLLVIVFLWFASPVSSHLIARLEVTTNEDKEKHYRKMTLRELEKALAEENKENGEEGEKA